MKVKNAKLIETANAIATMPALTKAPKAVFALGKNLSRLKAAIEPVEEARQKLFKEHFGDDQQVKNGDPRVMAYEAAYKQVLQTEVEFEAQTFKLEDLNLDTNALSPASLAAVEWLMV